MDHEVVGTSQPETQPPDLVVPESQVFTTPPDAIRRKSSSSSSISNTSVSMTPSAPSTSSRLQRHPSISSRQGSDSDESADPSSSSSDGYDETVEQEGYVSPLLVLPVEEDPEMRPKSLVFEQPPTSQDLQVSENDDAFEVDDERRAHVP